MRVLAILGLLVGCYGPTPPQGAPCGPGDSCPADQRCFDGLCFINAPVPDNDAATPDTPVTPGDSPADTSSPNPMTLRFGEGPGGLDDTWFDTFLNSGTGQVNQSMGVHPDLHLTASDIDPILIRVDVTSISPTATVKGARLTFQVTSETIPEGTKIEVFEMNESWDEGTGDHTDGVPNQTQRKMGLDWATAGAKPPSREDVAMVSVQAPALLEFGDELVITLPNSLIESWISNPNGNFGLAIIVDAGGFYCELASSEFPGGERRPHLEVDIE